MSEVIDFRMPSYAELEGAAADGFTIQVAPDEHMQVELTALRAGTAMSPEYECYAMVLALPHGVSLPQAMFRVRGPNPLEQEWLLLMTPIKPEADGRNALEAVIHRLRSAA